MPTQCRKKRTAVTCAACSKRKIRCARDGPPCSTCVRRRVPASQCVYETPATHRSLPSIGLEQSPAGGCSHTAGDGALTARIGVLEKLVQFQQSPGSMQVVQGTSAGGSESEAAGSAPTGTLITSRSGHTRFLPAASAWNVIRNASPDVPIADQGNTVTDTPSAPFPFARGTSDRLSDVLAILPPPEFCSELKDIYFRAVGPIYPIIHGPSFSKIYDQHMADAENAPTEWVALLFAILGTAVLAVDQDSSLLRSLSRKATTLERVAQLSERYYSTAMRCLDMDHYLWRHNLTTLQTLLLMIYGIHHSRGQTWTLLGLTYHLALSIGCHVDPTVFSLDEVNCEERRRCWLALMMLLCNQNMSMTGFDLHKMTGSFSIQSPSAVASSGECIEEAPSLPAAPGLNSVAYFIRKYRLFQLSSKISNLSAGKQHVNPIALQELDFALQAEQSALLQFSDSASATSAVFINLLQCFSHHLMILLHCRVIGDPSRPSHYVWSKQRCWHSARQVLTLHAEFTTSAVFRPHRWYIRGRGAFYAFHAASMLVFLASAERESSQTSEVRPLLDQCLKSLELFKTQSQICARSANILSHLMTKSGFVDQSTLGSADTARQTPSDESGSSQPAPHSQDPGKRNEPWQVGMENPDFVDLFGNFAPEQWLDSDYVVWQEGDMFLPQLSSMS
ncbi:Putative Zn(II)2Cys6 transcription factor [Beauveria bassiana ARSEF 2860]|uniref:Putative Zn(II)2Cys6 transcription factor n=1 Tax=Beauveria bassiana (strain ARSEF 2860) TaxID=655819 RepID=J4KNR4_BEAB2|nr:Putative Zn(II)2Cys6 transcription factor [Beauveria bassiana ARSEF 2860]EJP66159.1 Putative Zn(II)2Cys6 transcription factor [Beauveria bassiana ARSEF 2860]